MKPRRPLWRAYLSLARVSNLPTVWTNVLAGTVAAGGRFDAPAWLTVAAGVSLLYTAGMFLNDAADHAFDARHRRERPIPSGDVSLTAAVAAGALAMLLGLAVIAAAGPAPLVFALALAAAIVYYDYRHKRDPFGPVVMGVCRGLVHVVAAAAVAGTVPPRAWIPAAVLAAYVTALTLVAKRLGAGGAVIVPLLVAGISLVDAAIVLACGGGVALTLSCAAGCALTLILQRVVRGD